MANSSRRARAMPWQGTISDAAQIEALASGVRQDIMDTLLTAEEMSVRDLARQIGARRHALYYHLRELESVGLVQKREVSREDGRMESVYRVEDERLQIEYRVGDPENEHAVGRVVTSITRLADRDFKRGFEHPDVRASGPSRNLWGARGKAWLSEEDLGRVNELLYELTDIFSRPAAEDGTLCALTWVLTPVKSAAGRAP